MRITVASFDIAGARSSATAQFAEETMCGVTCQKGPARVVVPIVIKIDIETVGDDTRVAYILDRIRSDLALLEGELNRGSRRPKAEAATSEPPPSRCTACRYFTEGPTASPMCGHPAPVAVRDVNRLLEWVPYWCPIKRGQGGP